MAVPRWQKCCYVVMFRCADGLPLQKKWDALDQFADEGRGPKVLRRPFNKAIRSKCQENHKNFKVTVKILKPGQSASRVIPRVIETISVELLELRIIYHFQDIGHHVTSDFFCICTSARVGRVIVHRLINPLWRQIYIANLRSFSRSYM